MTHFSTTSTLVLLFCALASTQKAEAQETTIVPLANTTTQAPQNPSVNTSEIAETEYHAEYNRLGRQVRRLRIAGWLTFSLGTAMAFAGAGVFVFDTRSAADIILVNPVGPGLTGSGAGIALVGAALLITARFRLGRRNRLRQRYEQERAYFRPLADVGVSPGGLNFRLTF